MLIADNYFVRFLATATSTVSSSATTVLRVRITHSMSTPSDVLGSFAGDD
jgi:spore maturation protein SpmA